jgi:hypothetical protein
MDCDFFAKIKQLITSDKSHQKDHYKFSIISKRQKVNPLKKPNQHFKIRIKSAIISLELACSLLFTMEQESLKNCLK